MTTLSEKRHALHRLALCMAMALLITPTRLVHADDNCPSPSSQGSSSTSQTSSDTSASGFAISTAGSALVNASGSGDPWIQFQDDNIMLHEPEIDASSDDSIPIEPTEPEPNRRQEEIDKLERIAEVYKGIAKKFKDASDKEEKKYNADPDKDSLVSLAILNEMLALGADAMKAENDAIEAQNKANELKKLSNEAVEGAVPAQPKRPPAGNKPRAE